MLFWQSYTAMYPYQRTNYIRPTYCESRDGGKPRQLTAIRSSNQREYNV